MKFGKLYIMVKNMLIMSIQRKLSFLNVKIFLNIMPSCPLLDFIDWGLMMFETILQSYHGGQFTYSCVS